MDKKSLLSAFLTAILIAGLVLASALRFGTVQASTDVIGIITSDTTWTKANSPYSLTGPTAVGEGATLTIEAGTTVNLNEYYIQVNGTLIARGTDNDKIHFNHGSVIFTSVSNGWNEQTGSGSLIQNAVVTDSLSLEVSVKVTASSLNGLDINGGSSVVSYNSINSIKVKGGSPTISNNDVTGDFTIWEGSPTITANIIQCRPWARGGAPVFSGNKIFGGIHADSSGDSVTISNNELSASGDYAIIFVKGIHADISENKIVGTNNNPTGISVSGVLSSATISRNQIYGCKTGINVGQSNVQIHENVIFNNNIGINIQFTAPIAGASGPWAENKTADVQANTVTENSIGIQFAPYVLTSTIANNNIYDNSQYNFKLQYPKDTSIPNNWWGTTDAQAISQKIFDNKNDYNLGTVIFEPFLTAPNPEAPDATYVPTSTSPKSSPSLTPIPSPSPIPVPGQSFFFVESNSTVSALAFNSTSSELSFTVNGTEGTAGYVKVTIAKSLVSNAANIKVYFDGSQLEVAITEDADSWLLSFTYMHSTHQVTINFAAVPSDESPLGPALVIGLPIVAVVLFFVVTRIRDRKSKTDTE